MARIDGMAWLWFVAIGVCNGLAVLTMYAALTHGSIAVVAPLIACYPLATLVFGCLVLGPGDLTWRVGLGIAVTVLGIGILLRA